METFILFGIRGAYHYLGQMQHGMQKGSGRGPSFGSLPLAVVTPILLTTHGSG